MTVFNTFWKVINKYKGTIILFTVMLVTFGGINTTSNNSTVDFTNSKPDIIIVNNSGNNDLTKNLISYLEKNTNVKDVKNTEEARNDALFYREVNYIVYIPKDYQKDVLSGKTPVIDIKTVGDYTSSLAEMLLTRYLKIQSIYAKNISTEQELITAINKNLSKTSEVAITSKVDTAKTSKVSRYFNFASYSAMFIIIFVICMVLSSFHAKAIKKRTIISSMNYKTHNKYLLRASFIYSIIVWLLFMLLGTIHFSNTILSLRGLVYALNLFIFIFTSLTLALLLSTLIDNKDTVNGIVNVISLGSAFLCGAFIPTEWLPETVVKISRIFPTYWYVNSNDLLASLQTINMTSLNQVIINMIVMLVFALIFIIINNLVSKKKQIVG